MKYYCVYIITNRNNTVLYTGITSNLIKRIMQHKMGTFSGFSKKYSLEKLVYYEIHEDVNEAIQREKKIKRWKRKWKNELIENGNQSWKDLYNGMLI